MSTHVNRKVWKRAQSGHLEGWAEYARRRVAGAPERRELWAAILAELAAFGLSARAAHTAGELEHLPYRDAALDRVLLMNVLDHVRDAGSGLREMARVLRGGGTLVLSVDTYAGRRYQTKRLHKWWARARRAQTKHPLIFSKGSVERLLLGSGFRELDSLHVPGTKARRTLFLAHKC